MTPVMLGDFAKRCLSFVGITPELMERVFGLQEGGCGCQARKTSMNAFGFRIQYGIIMFLGGPSPMPWKLRRKIALGKLKFRCRKTITSAWASIRRNGSGVMRFFAVQPTGGRNTQKRKS